LGTVQASEEEQQALLAAEALRQQGQEVAAYDAFRSFVARYPSSGLTDRALLALGRLSVARGEWAQGEGYYRSLIERFPSSPHLTEALLERGIALYHVQEYDASHETLRQALRASPSLEQEAKAQYYLGVIAYQFQRYAEAIATLKLVSDISQDTALIERARTDLAAIVHTSLSEAELQHLAQQYSGVYPGDLLLMQLAQVYRAADKSLEEIAVWQQFLTAFPTHQQLELAQARLDLLQSALTTDATKIGVLLPLSGEGSVAGQRALWGIELAMATLRQRRPDVQLSLVIRDSQGTAVGARRALRALVTEEQVIGVVGPLFSDVATDLATLVDALMIPTISPYARDSDFPLLSPFAFRNSLTDAMQGRFLATYAMHTLKLSRFAVLYPDEPYGVALKDRFIENVLALQGEVVAEASYPPETTDFRQHIKRIGGVDDETLRDLLAGSSLPPVSTPPARPSQVGTSPPKEETEEAPILYDAVFLPGYYDKVGLIAPELAFFNITGVQLLGSDGWNSPKIVEIGERFVDGGIFVDGFFAEATSPLVTTFVKQFEARYGEQPGLLAAQAYDTFLIMAHLLQQGVKTRRQLREALLNVREYAGVSGITTIDPEGNAEKILYLLSIQDGHILQIN
jgi:ABC-type branched-subunit amino acid transport system substrate-binding protein